MRIGKYAFGCCFWHSFDHQRGYQADHISLRLDNEQIPLKAGGSDVVTSQKELSLSGQARSAVNLSINKSDQERENERLRRGLNQLKVKEVEKQQTQFGVGIND